MLLFLLVIFYPLAAETKECDFFHEFNATMQQCVCRLEPYPFDCEEQELPAGNCMTYNESTGLLAAGLCPYQQRFDGHITLDVEHLKLKLSVYSGSDLNKAMCGHLDREGFLCGRCNPNYGTAVYSKTFKCVQCNHKNKAWMWALYLALETVPITLVYIFITIFNIRATSPPYTSFLFHSQFISLINTFDVYKVLLSYGANQTLYKVTMAVLDIWNLDALRHILPLFCVSSSLSNFQVQLMRVVSSLYPLILVFTSYLVIELHGRNCKVLVLMWKPFNKCFSYSRRSWDPRSSNIATFSTIVTLSLLKVWSSMLYLLYPNDVHYQGNESQHTFLYIDPYVSIEDITDMPFFWPTALTLATATLIPTLILCIYPTRICRKVFFFCKPNKFQIFRIFTETFQGHYKDGTNGTCDYRAASSLVFILRILTTVSFYPLTSRAGAPEHALSTVMVYILISTSLFYAIAQPCKKQYMNNIESILYGLTAISFLAIINANLKPRADKRDLRLAMSTITLVLLLLPSVILFAKIIIISILSRLYKYWKSDQDTRISSMDALPDRINHPNECTPLVS